MDIDSINQMVYERTQPLQKVPAKTDYSHVTWERYDFVIPEGKIIMTDG